MSRNRWLSLISPLLLIGLWELAVQAGWFDRRFIAPPSEVFDRLGKLIADGSLFHNVGASLSRIVLGFLVGGIPGIILGLLMGMNLIIRALFQPLVAAIYPVPKIALIPIIVVVLGLNEQSKIASVAISVFFLVALNVMASVMQIDPKYFEVARSFGARTWTVFWTVALPGSLPGIMNSVKISMGFALTLIVGVEFVGANDGIGKVIWDAYGNYALSTMLAGLLAIAVVGWLITIILDEIEYILVPWQAAGLRVKEGRVRQRARTWWGAVRPWSYTAAVIPVLLGAAIAAYDRVFNGWTVLLALIGSIAIQMGTNLTNDYYDFRKGADSSTSLGTGGSLLRGDLTPRQVFIGGILAFGVGIAIGLYLVSLTGPFIFWLGLFSVAVGFFYTAGPFALAYVGLGEVAVFIFMGPVMVIGSYYVQAQTVTWPVVLASLPVGFLVAAILHANNLRDLESDKKIGKRTLATLLGRAGANVEYYVLVLGTYLSLAVMVLAGIAPWLTLISIVTLPFAIKLMRIVAAETEPKKLHPVLRQTARLHMQFGLLLVIGWAAAWLVGAVG